MSENGTAVCRDNRLKRICVHLSMHQLDDLKFVAQVKHLRVNPLIRKAVQQFLAVEYEKAMVEYLAQHKDD